IIGEKGSRYKLYWQGTNQGNAEVGILIAEKWSDKVVEVKRVNEHLVTVKMVIGMKLVNMVLAHAPQSGRSDDEKDEFWDKLIAMVSGIPDREMVVIAGDLNGHVGVKSDGYEGIHGGFGFGLRNSEGERILEFCDALGLVVGNTVFRREEKRLVTYESGGTKSMLDYILLRKTDRRKVRNIKVIPGEECVTQHHLVVEDFVTRKLQKKGKQLHAPRLRVWKLQDKNVQSRFAEALRAKGEAVTERSDVEAKWEAMKSNWVKAAEEVCGWTKGAPRHKVTWWWNDNVAKAIEEKRRCFKLWHKSKVENDREAYREAKRLARKAVAQENKRKELASELEKEEGKSNLFRIARQMARERQDVVGVNCLRDPTGNVVIGNDKIKDTWKSYMEKLLNVENAWDKDVSSGKVQGPSCRITEAEKAIGRMKKGKAAGPTDVLTEMLKASQEFEVQWLTDLSSRIFDEGRIPGDW
ncbi:hypothetical protein JGG83_23020, partial [Salmonella enterica subsp. enterica serovar Derby]|nr:hypothetical protein [Salmonella enterica subsp. enterica serovar Derby]